MNTIDSVKFSVVIPCFNSSEYVDRCFNCLLKQTIAANQVEVIFVDDCSSDNTIEHILSKKKQAPFDVKIIKNQINLGPGLSRRRAAEIAVGDYLCFCDSDDWYSASFLTDLNKEIIESSSDIVYFDMSYIQRGKVMRKNLTSHFIYGNKFSYLSNCGESLCNLSVRRSLFLEIVPIDIRNGEDLALVPLLIAKASKISHINNSYYNYVMRSDSVSLGEVKKDAFLNMHKAFNHIQKHLTNTELDCIEYLGIKTVLYNSTLLAIRGGNCNSVLCQIVTDFTKQYPSWNLNIHKSKLGKVKNVYLWALKNHLWLLSRLFVWSHSFLLTR